MINLLHTIYHVGFFSVGVLSVSLERISVGTFFALFTLSSRVMSQAGVLAHLPMTWSQIAVSVERINRFLSSIDTDIPNCLPSTKGILLKAENIELPNLSKVNLTCVQGSFIGIIGETGSGKTTLTMQAAGLVTARGNLSYYGFNSNDVMYIPSSGDVCPVMTLRENIDPCACDETLSRLLSLIGMEERWKISGLGYDDAIDDFALTLSSGERQRLALSRAFIRRPKILILDEALSNVDLPSAKCILRRLSEILLPYGSIILVSHREGELYLCNEVLDLATAVYS